MQQFKNLYILLPCHSLEDFPVHHLGDDAESLLSNWTVLWHPALITIAGKIPQWKRAEEVPDDLTNALVVIPTISKHMVPSDFQLRADESNTTVLSDRIRRSELESEIVSRLDITNNIPESAVSDFYALGYAYLQVQLMTRQLRYSSNLDLERFEELVVEAANAIESENLQGKLQSCFDLLLEEKNRYYPVDAHFIDYTLVAKTTIGDSLVAQLDRGFPTNLLMTGQLVEHAQQEHPSTFQAIQSAIENGTATLFGSHYEELQDPLVDKNAISDNLAKGKRVVENLLGKSPQVYARRTAGLTPCIPEILEKLDIPYAVHSTLDEGRFPQSMSINSRWESQGGEMAITLSQIPLDACAPESYVNLAVKIGESIDSEHVSTVVFAHWPNKLSPFFEDLKRAQKFGTLLGEFVLIDDYFDSVYDPGYGETRHGYEYRNAYLKQIVGRGIPNPISKYRTQWERVWRINRLQNLAVIVAVLSKSIEPDWLDEIQRLQSETECEHGDWLTQVANLEEKILEVISESDNDQSIVNPTNFSKRHFAIANTPAANSQQVDHVYLRAKAEQSSHWIVDLPSMGVCKLDAKLQSRKKKLGAEVVSGNKLRNEFFEVNVDEKTGGMRGLRLYSRRTNLLTQKLGIRRSTGKTSIDQGVYSEMVADRCQMTELSAIAGQAQTNGKLILDKQVVGEFQQTIRVSRGTRVIEFDIEVDLQGGLSKSDPWGNYFCNRLAWLEEAATLTRGMHGAREQITEQRICAPEYIEIAEPDYQLTLLTRGLPFHQRVSRRQLDSLLVVSGETSRRFQFAISVNQPYAMQAVMSDAMAPYQVPISPRYTQASQWLFHWNCKNIVTTRSQPILGENGEMCGVQFRMQETEGRRGDLKIRCPYKIQRAILLNYAGHPMEELKVDDNMVIADFLGTQMFDIEIHW